MRSAILFLMILLLCGCVGEPEMRPEDPPEEVPFLDEELARQAGIFARTIRFLHDTYPEPDKVTYQKLFENATRGAMQGLDRYSGYENVRDFERNSKLRDGVSPARKKAVQKKAAQSVFPEPAPADGIKHIRISNFFAGTAGELKKALDAAKKEGPFRALILDLRNNPGGHLNAALQASSLFLPKKTLIVYSVNRGKRSELRSPPQDGPYPDVPLFILVSRRSASCAELFAGSLQKNKRARIYGERTFGKGTILRVTPLPGGGALRSAIAYYELPGGIPVEKKGILPDVPCAAKDAQSRAENDMLKILKEKDEKNGTLPRSDHPGSAENPR